MPPKATPSLPKADVPAAPPRFMGDNDSFLENSSKNRAVAALFLCASEEYKTMCHEEMMHHASSSSEENDIDTDLHNCDITLSSIAAASHSIDDALSVTKSKTELRFMNELYDTHRAGYYWIRPEWKYLSVFCAIKSTPRSRIAMRLGDQRPLCFAAASNEILSGQANRTPNLNFNEGIQTYPVLTHLREFNLAPAIATFIKRCVPYYSCTTEGKSYDVTQNAFFPNSQHIILAETLLACTPLPMEIMSVATARALYFLLSRLARGGDVLMFKTDAKKFPFQTQEYTRKLQQSRVQQLKANIALKKNTSTPEALTYCEKIVELLEADFENGCDSRRVCSLSPQDIDKLLPLSADSKPASASTSSCKKYAKLRDIFRDNMWKMNPSGNPLHVRNISIEDIDKLIELCDEEIDYPQTTGATDIRDFLREARAAAVLRTNAKAAAKSTPEHMIDNLEEFGDRFINSPGWQNPKLSTTSYTNAVFDIFNGYPQDRVRRVQQELPEKFADEHLILFKDHQRLNPGQPAFVRDADTFLNRWSKISMGVLDQYSSPNAYIIGGSVVSCLNPEISDDDVLDGSAGFKNEKSGAVRDLDLVFAGVGHYGFQLELMRLDKYMCENYPDHLCVGNNHTRTYVLPYPLPRVQVILGCWNSISNCLTFSDVDCCGVAFSMNRLSEKERVYGNNDDDNSHQEQEEPSPKIRVFATPRAMHSFIYRVNVPSKHAHWIRGSIKYEMRLVKYARRDGFAIAHSDVPANGGLVDKLKSRTNQTKWKMNQSAGLVWCFMVSENHWCPVAPPQSALETGPDRRLVDVETDVEEEGYEESDGYGTHESGYFVHRGRFELKHKGGEKDGQYFEITDDLIFEYDLTQNPRFPTTSSIFHSSLVTNSTRVDTIVGMSKMEEETADDCDDWNHLA